MYVFLFVIQPASCIGATTCWIKSRKQILMELVERFYCRNPELVTSPSHTTPVSSTSRTSAVFKSMII